MTHLPKTWARVLITEVLEPNINGKPFQQGWSPQCENVSAGEDQWGVLKTTAIQHGAFWDHENKRLPRNLEPRPHLEVKPGDVVMTCAGPRSRCGVACLVERTRPKLLMSGKMYRFRPHPTVMHPKYLAYFLQTRESQIEIDRMKTGISDSGLNLTHDRFGTLKVTVAPINEQRRIVTKIEELFSELDNGVESLTTALDMLMVYRQVVLKQAFEGKLTQKWRALHQDAVSDSREYTSDSGLPFGWHWAALDTVALAIDPHPSHRTPPTVPGGIPYVGVGDIDKATKQFNFDAARKVSPNVLKEHIERYQISDGDFIIGKIGTIGKPFKVPTEHFYALSANVVLVRPIAEKIDPTYLFVLSESPVIEKQFEDGANATTQAAFGIKKVRQLMLPICSLDEQKVISEMLMQIFESIDRLDGELRSQLVKLEALRQSILKTAFSGELVAQDPNDVPVSVLVERIKAEMEVSGNGQKKNNRKKEAA